MAQEAGRDQNRERPAPQGGSASHPPPPLFPLHSTPAALTSMPLPRIALPESEQPERKPLPQHSGRRRPGSRSPAGRSAGRLERGREHVGRERAEAGVGGREMSALTSQPSLYPQKASLERGRSRLAGVAGGQPSARAASWIDWSCCFFQPDLRSPARPRASATAPTRPGRLGIGPAPPQSAGPLHTAHAPQHGYL